MATVRKGLCPGGLLCDPAWLIIGDLFTALDEALNSLGVKARRFIPGSYPALSGSSRQAASIFLLSSRLQDVMLKCRGLEWRGPNAFAAQGNTNEASDHFLHQARHSYDENGSRGALNGT